MTLFEDHQASNNSSSCKRNKLELIDDYLLSTGFKRNPICKDGSCLFRAVAEQLFKTQKYHVSVREACVRYMKRHQHLFENFVDNSFDDYLHKMMNPKEWADQLEISALSKMYSCDFYIYDQPGHEAKNVTDNGYSKHVYLCQSGQRHYDSVFPITKFESFGFCQALIYDMLLLRVFGTTATERNKIMTTFRMLNCKESDDNVEEFYPSERIYEPSIGLTTEGVSLCRQNGLGYNLPVSLAFIRSLDPTVYRNVEYDLWVEIKRKQQFLDNSYAVGMNYFIGDRCLVSLSIFSKPLVGHVQEVTPNNGPITCFIEALGEMHTTAVRNIKPLDSPNNNSARSSDGGGSWSSSSRSRRKSSSDTFWGGAGGHNNNNSSRNSGGGRRNNSYKSKFGFSEMSSSLPNVDNHNFGGRFNNNELSKRRNNNGSTSSNVGRQTQRSDYFNKKNSDHATPPRRLNKGERKNRWNNNRQQRAASTSNYSPSYSNHGANNNLPPHNYQDSPEWHEDTFDECGGTSYSGADGKWASSQDGGFVTDGGGSDQVFHSPTKDVNNNIPANDGTGGYSNDGGDGGVVYQWNNYSNSPGNDDSSIIESRSTSQMNASVVDSPMSLGYGQVQLMSPAAAGGDNEEHYQQNVTNNNSTTATAEGEMQESPATNDGDVDNSNQAEQLDNIDDSLSRDTCIDAADQEPQSIRGKPINGDVDQWPVRKKEKLGGVWTLKRQRQIRELAEDLAKAKKDEDIFDVAGNDIFNVADGNDDIFGQDDGWLSPGWASDASVRTPSHFQTPCNSKRGLTLWSETDGEQTPSGRLQSGQFLFDDDKRKKAQAEGDKINIAMLKMKKRARNQRKTTTTAKPKQTVPTKPASSRLFYSPSMFKMQKQDEESFSSDQDEYFDLETGVQ